MNRPQIEQQLITRATQDPAFRQTLLSDPRGTIQRETGMAIPAGMDLRVVEESANSLCLVLPAPEGELSDLELEAVAGGKTGGIGPSNLAGEEAARKKLGEL